MTTNDDQQIQQIEKITTSNPFPQMAIPEAFQFLGDKISCYKRNNWFYDMNLFWIDNQVHCKDNVVTQNNFNNRSLLTFGMQDKQSYLDILNKAKAGDLQLKKYTYVVTSG